MGAASFAVSTAFKAKDGVSPVFNSMVRGAGKLENRFSRLSNKTMVFGSCMQGTFKKMNNLMNGFIGLFAFQKLNQFRTESTKAITTQLEAESKLTQFLKNNAKIQAKGAGAYLKISQELFNMASDLQQKGVIGDEILIGGMQELASMGFDDSIIKKMMPVIADLAVKQKGYNVTIQDTETIAKGLGRALSGNAGALSKMGVVLDKNQQKQLQNMSTIKRSEYLYKLLSKRVGGLNQQFANSDLGAETQYKNNMGDRMEEIGKRMLPIQGRFFKLMNKQMPLISKLITIFFDTLEWGAKKMQPVFSKMNGLFSYLSSHLLPELIAYEPMIKGFFENVFVPGCMLAMDAINLLFQAVDNIYNCFKNAYLFIKDNFIPITSILAGILGGILYFNLQNIAWSLLDIGLRFGTATKALLINTGQLVFNKLAWWALGVALDTAKLKMLLFAGVWGLVIAGAVLGILWLVKNWDKVTAAIGVFWKKCQEVFSKIGTFIKNNFVDVLLEALGPIGLIFKGIRKISKGIRGLKTDSSDNSDETDDTETFPDYRQPRNNKKDINGNNNSSTLPFAKEYNPTPYGKIEIVSKIENETPFPLSSSINIAESKDLTFN